MKLLSYRHDGSSSWGLATSTGVVELACAQAPDLRSAIAQGIHLSLAQAALGRPDTASFAQIEFLPVIPQPGQIFCIGHNYEEHRMETQRSKTEHPAVFLRLANSQTGHLEPMLMPRESTQLDYEGEIAIIIGQGGRRIAEADAWRHIAGYGIYNDGSVRDWQYHTSQFTPGKNFMGTGAFGPWMVTRDEIADGEVLQIQTRLNGEVMQKADTSMLIFSFPRLIAYVSTFTSLAPGDVIVTGTPGGVGARRNPPVWMKPSDRVEIEVPGIGVLANTIAVETVRA